MSNEFDDLVAFMKDRGFRNLAARRFINDLKMTAETLVSSCWWSVEKIISCNTDTSKNYGSDYLQVGDAGSCPILLSKDEEIFYGNPSDHSIVKVAESGFDFVLLHRDGKAPVDFDQASESAGRSKRLNDARKKLLPSY